MSASAAQLSFCFIIQFKKLKKCLSPIGNSARSPGSEVICNKSPALNHPPIYRRGPYSSWFRCMHVNFGEGSLLEGSSINRFLVSRQYQVRRVRRLHVKRSLLVQEVL